MKLTKTNNLPLDQFINFALYDKDKGFYMKKNPFGKMETLLLRPMSQDYFQRLSQFGRLLFGKALALRKNLIC